MEKSEQNFLANCRRFFYPVKENKKAFLKRFFVTFLWSINIVIHVLFLERVSFFLESQNQHAFEILIYIYIAYILGFEIINFLVRKWGWVEAIPYTWNTLTKQYFAHYVKLDNNEVEKEGTGKLIAVIGGGVRQWGFSLVNLVEAIMKVSISLLFALYMVVKMNAYYGVIFLILMVIFLYIAIIFNKKQHKYRKERNDNSNIVMKSWAKVIMTKIEILQSNKIGRELEKLTWLFMNDSEINKKMGTYRQIMNRSSAFWISVIFVISYIYLGKQYFDGAIGLNVVVGFGGALVLMQRSIADALTFYIQFTKDFIVIEKLWDFFDSTPKISGYDTGKIFKYKTGKIEIKSMSFSYTKGTKVFDNFNLEIPGGKVTAFVGNSGSGKSTLVKIISGYLTHNKGEVIIDGQRNKDISLKSLYKHVGYLTQEPSVFDGSIRENLMYGIADRVDVNLEKAMQLAKCEFIYDFPDGLDTEIGEKGIRLSGGQRQRLAIAKIFLKNPEIIILDEPTSALDSFSEEQITIAMENLFKDRTVIIIAHRLQTVKNADKILVLENGKIVEEGTHNSLVKKKGIYKKMLDLQSGF